MLIFTMEREHPKISVLQALILGRVIKMTL